VYHANNLFFIHPDFFVLTQKQKLTTQATTATSPMSGGPWATEEGTYNASESEPVCTRV
jgi:hypothetical protein